MNEDRRALLVRVGIDSTAGSWNAPIHPDTGEYVYVPIPESRRMREGLDRRYEETKPAIERLSDKYGADLSLPEHLAGRSMHLDPDFEHLTYGDANARASQLSGLSAGDILVFYASFEPLPGMEPEYPKNNVYALIGLFHLEESPTTVMDESSGEIQGIAADQFKTNAHLRRDYPDDIMERRRSSDGQAAPDVVVHADPSRSGRLQRTIDIGIYRRGAYRVRRPILDAWGGLSVKDGFLQRSGTLPEFRNPERFLDWFDRQEPNLKRDNFG